MNGSDVKATVVRCGTASLVTHAVSLELLIHFDKWMFVWVSVSSDYTYHDYTYHDWFNAWWFTCESAASWGRLLHWSRIPRSLVTFFFLPLKQTCTPSQIDRFRLKTICPLLTQSDLLLVTRELIGWAVVKPVCFARKKVKFSSF